MLFNQFIIKILPYLPLSVIRLIAGRYVAGETSEDALNVVKALNQQGFSATVDILGEHTNNENKLDFLDVFTRNLYRILNYTFLIFSPDLQNLY